MSATATRAFRFLDTAIGDSVLPLYVANGAPVNGTSGTLAGAAPIGALLITSEPALYQNTGSVASPTWSAIEPTSALTPLLASPPAIGGTAPNSGKFTSLVSTGYTERSVTAGIVAGTTHTLVGATPLTTDINQVATVANASDAVALPAAVPGMKITIFNDGAHVLAVWPQTADAIDGGSAGVAVSLTNTKRCDFFCTAANTWESAQLGVASA